MDCAKNIRRQLGPGYVESVYKNAMVLELRKLGLHHETEKPIVVYYDECVVGEFKADIVVEGILILELKAVSSIHVAHEVGQLPYFYGYRQRISHQLWSRRTSIQTQIPSLSTTL